MFTLSVWHSRYHRTSGPPREGRFRFVIQPQVQRGGRVQCGRRDDLTGLIRGASRRQGQQDHEGISRFALLDAHRTQLCRTEPGRLREHIQILAQGFLAISGAYVILCERRARASC